MESMTDLSREIFFFLPGAVEPRLVEEGLGAEGGDDNLDSVMDRSEYRAFRVCRMKPEEVRYRGKPSICKVFGNGAGRAAGGV